MSGDEEYQYLDVCFTLYQQRKTNTIGGPLTRKPSGQSVTIIDSSHYNYKFALPIIQRHNSDQPTNYIDDFGQ